MAVPVAAVKENLLNVGEEKLVCEHLGSVRDETYATVLPVIRLRKATLALVEPDTVHGEEEVSLKISRSC